MTPDRFIAAAFRDELLALAQAWQDEAAGTWGETKEHATLQLCCDKLRAKLSTAELARESVGDCDPREVARAALAAYDNWAMTNMRAADDDGGIEAAARVIESATRSVGGDWLPIESAPKDGTSIVLGYENSHSEEGRWVEDGTRNYWGEAGWFATDDDVLCSHPSRPTHWQPLPAPPLAGVSEGKE